jgi:small multidrug resistance pump
MRRNEPCRRRGGRIRWDAILAKPAGDQRNVGLEPSTAKPPRPLSPTTRAILVTVIFGAIGVVGDSFLKIASADEISWRSRWFFVGFALYASTAFSWVFVKKHLKLATIGVFYSVVLVVLLTLVGTVFFGERLSAWEVLGIAMGIGSMVIQARLA